MRHAAAGSSPALPNRAPGAPRSDASSRRGQLALTLQEVLTAVVRLRASRRVAADAGGFRESVKHMLAVAEDQARRLGYNTDDVRLAIFAVVAFLDESVLNSGQPMFADWPRKPLQDELFGGLTAGEVFFQQLHQLLTRQDSEDLADVLEVYELCMLLGFQGRYNAAREGALQALTIQVGDKIARIRGPLDELSAAWRPPAGQVGTVTRDRWVRRLGYAAVGTTLAALLLFAAYRISLRPTTLVVSPPRQTAAL
jgi:type VI secretion system protein ImpK